MNGPTVARPRLPIRLVAVGLATAALLTGGCGSDLDATRSATSSWATWKPADGLPAGAAGLVGRYAHYDVVAYQDASMKTLIISTGFADLEMRGGKLWNVQRFCHADTVTDQKIDVSISDAATRAIVPVDTPVQVTRVGGRLRVVRPATPTAIGIAMDDPAHEALPSDPNDPRIVDADGDGKPGVTSRVRVSDQLQGEIYLARREIFSYDVTRESPDRLVGSVTDKSEQLILGASSDLFRSTAQWKQVDDPTRNPVIWTRVGPDWDCARLAENRDALFPPNPKADW